MSDNEQEPSTPQLTRRQLRELRNTASNPVIVDAGATADDAGEPDVPPAVVSAPLPRPAEPVEVPPAPVPQTSVDLGAPALTRRQARQQEKIRTASIPVIITTGEHVAPTPAEMAAADSREDAGVDDGAPVDEHVDSGDQVDADQHGDAGEQVDADQHTDSDQHADAAEHVDAAEHADATEHVESDDHGDTDAPQVEDVAEHDEPADNADDVATDDAVVEETASAEAAPIADVPSVTEVAEIDTTTDDADGEPGDEVERHVVSNDLGADLLAGDSVSADVPASFDQLLSRSAAATGAFTAPNALILEQNPDAGPFVAPVNATGEVLITGTFALPEHYGSTGVVPGSADGKEVDAVLMDGELPPASSPTPIAASAAISTIKSAEDVIRPPAPEKGSRWTVALAITAGVLAVALAGVLIVALVTGVFQ
ncbi:hypothetical protein [Microbacterium thalli]|uniref:Uncharacterized protein n=1 Tax=Microbacterium thalli TaxID=3027921 RepID=A0ABT5SJ33_9MICO|nr:hypothetical protein [Microbacterium thalli]MDD7962809.1 hypothetical protein [Microbacterium thalli]